MRALLRCAEDFHTSADENGARSGCRKDVLPMLRVTGIVVATLLLWNAPTALSKMPHVTLSELVRMSDIVVLARAKRFESIQATQGIPVRIAWIEILRAPKLPAHDSREMPICEYPGNSEYMALSSDATYLIFARKRGECFEPIYGYRGVAHTRGSSIYLGSIDGEQQEWQEIDAVVGRIEVLTKQPR